MPGILVLFFAIHCTIAADTPTIPSANDLNAAAREYEQGNFDVAIAALDRFEKGSPATVESIDLRGCILMEQQKFDGAKQAFELSHQTSPETFAPRIHLGDLLMRQKKYAEARTQYQQLLKETNILMSNERLRFAVLLTYLGEKDEEGAKTAFNAIKFPTQTPAYYYAQAAWAFAHNKKSEGRDWLDKAQGFQSKDATTWFAQHIYHFGWIKDRPPLSKLHN